MTANVDDQNYIFRFCMDNVPSSLQPPISFPVSKNNNNTVFMRDAHW